MARGKSRRTSKRKAPARPSPDTLEGQIGHCFRDPDLLRLALTHAAVAGGIESNERLEFLGDRVLGLIVADMLYRRFPNETEAALARRFVAAVRSETLTEVAETLNLERYLKLARETPEALKRGRAGMLADACEALIAAIFLDGGLKATERFVAPRWQDRLNDAAPPPKDAKSALQEWAQGRGLPLPSYREVGRSGPAHVPRFQIEAAIKGHAPARGEGPSKRAAEQDAAAKLLARLGS